MVIFYDYLLTSFKSLSIFSGLVQECNPNPKYYINTEIFTVAWWISIFLADCGDREEHCLRGSTVQVISEKPISILFMKKQK